MLGFTGAGDAMGRLGEEFRCVPAEPFFRLLKDEVDGHWPLLLARYRASVLAEAREGLDTLIRRVVEATAPVGGGALQLPPLLAAVYCDVVVTEKLWVHWLQQGKADERYKTKLLSDAAGLVDVLGSSSS